MTLSTSDGRGLLLQQLARSSVRWRSSLSRRVFSMAMTAWAAKFCHQLDLLVGEQPDLLAVDEDRADQLVLLEHRHGEEGARARQLDDARRSRRARRSRALPQCRVLHDAWSAGDRPSGVPAGRINGSRFRRFVVRRRRVMHATMRIARPRKSHIAELGVADACRVLQHRLEYRLQVAGRAGDDLQHLGGRGLLLQRLGEFVRARRSARTAARSRSRSPPGRRRW